MSFTITNRFEVKTSGKIQPTPVTQSYLEPGLILYLDSNIPSSYPGSGNTWYDLSGTGSNFTITGSLTYSANDGFSGFTKTGDNYIFRSNWPSIPLKTGAGGAGYTVLVWANATASNATFGKLIGNRDTENYIDLWDRSNKFHEEDDSSLYVNGISVASNTYNMYTASGYRLYGSVGVNGGGATHTTPFYIGYDKSAYSYFPGRVAVVKVYNRQLTTGEMISYYSSSKARFGL
jgi:hypothetical protein